MAHSAFIPAAEYVRTSTNQQPNSINFQKQAIAAFAAKEGFVIVRSYADEGKSGLTLSNRPGLVSLLHDVAFGTSEYRAILVYDVTRWGRFQDVDESAHYEFLCKALHVPVYYCAEAFGHDPDLPTFILKTLRRVVAAEYSRELSVKCFRGQKHLAGLGFRMGALPGYGLRRLAMSPDGKSAQILGSHEWKSVASDRVVLIPGPEEEVSVVRLIFDLATRSKTSFRAIARELSKRGIRYRADSEWTDHSVGRLIRNRKYAGYNVWNRVSRNLGMSEKRNSIDEWVVVPQSHFAIVDDATFEIAQKLHPRPRRWSDAEVVQGVRRLAQYPVAAVPTSPSLATLRRRAARLPFLRSRRGTSLVFRSGEMTTRQRTLVIRNNTFDRLLELFPTKISDFHLRGKSRPILRLEDETPVSVIVCPKMFRRTGIMRWSLDPVQAEAGLPTLLCLEEVDKPRYCMVPEINLMNRTFVGLDHRILQKGAWLDDLTQFYDVVYGVIKTRLSTLEKHS